MLKHFRVPGRLAVKLEELGISVPTVLRRACLPRDLFEQTRVLVSTSELFALWRAIDYTVAVGQAFVRKFGGEENVVSLIRIALEPLT